MYKKAGDVMATTIVRDLYASPNGDRWDLGRNGDGELVVRHQPNRTSGGVVSEIAIDVFLSHGSRGPEYQALSVALTELDPASKISDDSTSDARTTEKIDRALGQAVARCWSKFVPKIQQTLFEAAVQAEGENVRQALAIHLHDKHERTAQSAQAKAILEPDSLGG
jgi:hypothetical protein